MIIYAADVIEGFKGMGAFVVAGLAILAFAAVMPSTRKDDNFVYMEDDRTHYFFVGKTREKIKMKDVSCYCVENGRYYFKDGRSFHFYKPGTIDVGIKLSQRRYNFEIVHTVAAAQEKLNKSKKTQEVYTAKKQRPGTVR